TVTDSAGTVHTVDTDANGRWTVTGLAIGDATVNVNENDSDMPIGSAQTVGTDPTTHTVVAGTDIDTEDDGYQQAGLFGDVFNDLDKDGVMDSGEELANIEVTVTDSAGTVHTVDTDANGRWTVTGLAIGDATVNVNENDSDMPANLSQTVGTDPSTHAVTAGNDSDTEDDGYMETGTVSGHLYYDTNGNGKQDTGEPNLPNVDVVITDANNNPQTVITDSNGDWTATVPPGSTTANVDETDTDFTSVVPMGFTQTEGNDPTTVIAVADKNISAGNDGYYKATVIGNRVWLDENGDGVQDAGEAGISGVTVYIDTDNSGGYTAGDLQAVTDSNGNYMLKGVVAPDTHTVLVKSDTLPAGLVANPTYDEDGTGTPHQTEVTLSAGENYLTADFGYNWASPTDTDTPTATTKGAIGDRIWNDADGDGVQDPGEVGIVGVTVKLLTDDNGDGVYGGTGDTSTPPTTTTGPDGRYIFDDLAPGSYVVEVDSSTLPTGYNTTPSGDPDSTADGKTTSPVVLAPGDVFVNADFGYNIDNDSDPDTAESGGGHSIGDFIYLDTDASGTYSAVDTGIAGVSVVLYEAGPDNIPGNSDDIIVGTVITDESGAYRFDGLPDGNYTVKVVDSGNVLDGLSSIADPDGGADNESNITLSGINLDQDFGYAPAGHSSGEGLISDRIFLDTVDGIGGAPNNAYDVGEGLEGVTVQLYDSTGSILLATTSTDKYGRYEFGNLDISATYQVHVDTTTLPNGGAGLTNSIDPDGSNDSVSTINLSAETDGTPNDGIVLDQNFGYTAGTPNTISGTIWDDTNADGELSGETGVFSGVTVVLRDESTSNIVATTLTDVNGNYSFGNLPDDTYTVDVVDTTGVLDGYWHSVGPNAGDGSTDNNSQEDPYTVTVSGGMTDSTGDFGYYKKPASVSHLVWEDLNGDGKKDTGEQGIPNVKVTATVTYDNGATFTITTKTDKDGNYSFDNLLLDEDYNGSGGPAQPSYVIQVEPPAGMISTHTPPKPTQ
ncbi:MAG: hypothetical protein D3913_12350, partial [Candidatus Electrothrix sp. LOE1_4_5]|nr:hypothetical protein [Candidatus Electrothrix gigas]